MSRTDVVSAPIGIELLAKMAVLPSRLVIAWPRYADRRQPFAHPAVNHIAKPA